MYVGVSLKSVVFFPFLGGGGLLDHYFAFWNRDVNIFWGHLILKIPVTVNWNSRSSNHCQYKCFHLTGLNGGQVVLKFEVI